MSILGNTLLLGIPTLSSARRSIEWTDATNALHMPLGNAMGREWVRDRPIAEARNMLCTSALRQNIKYLMMLGDDVIAPAESIMTFLNKVGRYFEVADGKQVKAQLITGIYWTKEQPPEPYIYKDLAKGSYKDWLAGEFFPIDLAGCDCLFIDTDVLRAIPYPWFSTDWVWEPGQTNVSDMTTEDFYFFAKAKKYGFQLFADTSIQCYHEDRNTGAWYGPQMDMLQFGGIPEIPDNADGTGKVIADIGAGLWAPTIGNNSKFVRFDIREDSKPDVRCDILNIDPHYNEKFDTVFASHILEHTPRDQVVQTLTKWSKLLKVGGELIIKVPNLEDAFRCIIDAIEHPGENRSKPYDWDRIYGGLNMPYEKSTHLTGFVTPTLLNAMRMIPGMKDVKVELSEGGINLKATAIREKIVLPEDILSMLFPERLEQKPELIENLVM